MGLFKRLILSLFLVASGYLLFTISPALALTTPASNSAATNSYNTPSTNPDVPKNLHTWTQNVMIETMAALTCQLAGVDPINPNGQCLGVDQQTGKIGFVKNGGGAIGVMGNMTTMLYTPPTHTGEYFQNLASNFGLVKSAQADTGTGFQGLSPLLGIWSAFRNIVYLLFVVIFVIVGIAIMLRVKIDPRTVMSIQNQIPKIIVGLIFVTFSFAIAGFLIDIMYTSIYLTGNAIVATDDKIPKDNSLVIDISKSTNPLQAANEIGGANGGKFGLASVAWVPARSVGRYIIPVFDNETGRVITGVAMAALGTALAKPVVKGLDGILTVGGAIIGTIVGTPGAGTVGGAAIGSGLAKVIGFALGGAAGAIAGPEIMGGFVTIIAFLIISIAILFAMFRLWFALLSAYVFVLLDVVTAPFWIFAGLIPGSPIGFGLWLRDIVSNLVAFPIAIILLLLGRVFTDAFGSVLKDGQFVPPLLGNPSAQNDIGSLIGLGFILLTPNVVAMAKAALKAPKFDTTPIKQAIGVGAGVPGGALKSTGAYFAKAQNLGEKGGATAVARRIFGF